MRKVAVLKLPYFAGEFPYGGSISDWQEVTDEKYELLMEYVHGHCEENFQYFVSEQLDEKQVEETLQSYMDTADKRHAEEVKRREKEEARKKKAKESKEARELKKFQELAKKFAVDQPIRVQENI
jgi:spore germination cell wall hydrolase CwlJ-like protein